MCIYYFIVRNITDGTVSVSLALHHGKSIPSFLYKEETDESDAEVWQLKYNGQGKTGCRKGGCPNHIGNYCKKIYQK